MAENWGGLKKIDGHPGYSVDPKSGIIYWRGTIRGKHLKISTRETQISKAKGFIGDYLLELNSDNFDKARREQKGVADHRIEDVFNECVQERSPTRSESTVKRYPAIWRIDLAPFWGSMSVSELTAKNVAAFENWYVDRFPGKVFFMARKNLIMLINYAHREGYIHKKLKVTDLDKTLNKFKKKKHFRVYTNQEQKALLKATDGSYAHAALVMYFDTGMRKMELLNRKLSDVDFKAKTIQVWSQKNKIWRNIPLTKRAIEVLKARAKDLKGDYLFPMKSKDEPMSGQLFDKAWIDAKRLAGIGGKSRVHDIRHTFATTTARDGWPIPIACAVLDMTPSVYIGTYVHITPEDIQKHMRRSFEK